MNIKNIDKKDIFGFLIAFLVAFVMFKNTPSIEYPIIHTNHIFPKSQKQNEETTINQKVLYAPKYLFVKEIFNLPPTPAPVLPPLAQALFVSNTVSLVGVFERGNVRFGVLKLPNQSFVTIHQGQSISAYLGGGPPGAPQSGGGMPGLPSLPQLLGMAGNVHPPSPPGTGKMINPTSNPKEPSIKVLSIGPHSASFLYIEKIPEKKGAFTFYKYKRYTKTLYIFKFR
jgi:hypothetical protein